MTEQDELAQLLQRTALGDRAAFARLYERTAPKLLAAGMHLLKRREFAEDVLQDVFVKVWHRASEYHAERGSALTRVAWCEVAEPSPYQSEQSAIKSVRVSVLLQEPGMNGTIRAVTFERGTLRHGMTSYRRSSRVSRRVRV